MDDAQILQSVADIIRDVLDDPTLTIVSETQADQISSWDSFNHINIVVAVERKFAIKFKTAEIESLRNVGELVALVSQKLKAKG